jgi:hypothetical protein
MIYYTTKLGHTAKDTDGVITDYIALLTDGNVLRYTTERPCN